ncbi:MAG: SMC-Scp complex subunit ScpB [Gammaproteobacteria bacterium]
MSENYIQNVVEAALLAAGRPLQLPELALLFDEPSRPEPAVLRAALDALEADYSSRGIEVKETATGFRIQVRRELANEVSRLWPERPPRYSRALLETLALIAYRQPITRAEIEAVRGVAVNPNIIKTVLERNWVRVVGTRDVPGRPELLGTTKEFLDYFGLRALDDLPPLAELKAMGEINLQLDLAKPTDPSGEGSEGSGGAGGGEGASGAGEGGGGSAVAAIGALAVIASAAHASANEATQADDAAIGDNAESEPATAEEALAFEHEPVTSALAHVEIESDSGDDTVEVEALTLVEERIDDEIESGDSSVAEKPDASIEAGEFEMSELGMTSRPVAVIEAEFDADDLDSTSPDDDAADDDDELSAGPHASTELVAAPPRDRDD